MIKALLFDLDGTLLDTVSDIQNNLNIALKENSLPTISKEQTIKFIGNGAAKLVERALFSEQDKFEQVFRRFSALYAASKNDLTQLYDGEEDFLLKAKEKGYKLAIISNKPQSATETVYAQYLQRFGFDFVIGKREDFPTKPDATSTHYVMSKLGVSAEECLFIGDGETDVQTAKNAGVKCVSVLWGYRDKVTLQSAGATCFAEDYSQLSQLVFQ